ncbi:MAG: hypothetical protein KKE86_11380 [Planctomycetes bacterium]|nr:hypothetical protein [Planctomycetota bacterium]MBU4399922.1 hypothetical protein [Planctomycetota bacterium]MCG2683389.1 hypothetical protein [Planctomycetales bacterium]
MPDQNNPSVETFVRFVEERFQDFRDRLSKLMSALAADDKQQKVARANTALEAANSLRQALAKQDQPGWLQPITNTLHNYVANAGHSSPGTELINAIGLHYGAVAGHKWAFEFSDDRGFDFDGVFRKYEDESRIPELFDKLVELLEKIVQCEDLDSRTVVRTLETIIATLKKNRNGSYFSVMGTWNFTGTYLKNIAWNMLLEIPFLKVPVKSLQKTMEQLDKEMEKVHENMRSDLHKQLHAEFPVLTYRALPIPEPLALTDETVIDAEVTPVGDREKQPS